MGVLFAKISGIQYLFPWRYANSGQFYQVYCSEDQARDGYD
ncbi:hypothetical protein RINTHM_7900 [Richelia intracellularis HM01]|nr:hypothetical protein RINTHM_7900 [Richelia intracellularis HM01]